MTSRITNKTYMQVDYPRGKKTIGYISQEGKRQLISMLGAKYSVKDLLDSGYTFSALIAVTPGRIQALTQVLDDIQVGVIGGSVNLYETILIEMLKEMEGE